MGVDYIVQRDCPAQRAFTVPGFLAAMARRRQAQLFNTTELVIDGVRHAIAPIGRTLPVVTTRGDQVVHSEVTPGDALTAWEKQCDGCPARTYDQPFGCYGYIAYPIRATTEQWLIERAKPMDATAAIAITVLGQHGITGSRVAALRAQGRSFFESPTPAGVIWQLADQGEVVMSSDLIVELALFQLPGRPQLFPFAAVLLGLVAPTTAETMIGWMKFPKTIGASLIMPSDDAEQADFVDYLRQLIAAARGGFDLATDG